MPWDTIKRENLKDKSSTLSILLNRKDQTSRSQVVRPLMNSIAQKSDDEDMLSVDSSDEENFSEKMHESVAAMLPGKKTLFDEDGVSKNLRAYASSIDYQKDKVLTNSGLNIVKKIFPLAIQLMGLCRGNFAFDLFISMTHICEIYLFTVLCCFSTCNMHSPSYF